jgi:hypothetical protein
MFATISDSEVISSRKLFTPTRTVPIQRYIRSTWWATAFTRWSHDRVIISCSKWMRSAVRNDRSKNVCLVVPMQPDAHAKFTYSIRSFRIASKDPRSAQSSRLLGLNVRSRRKMNVQDLTCSLRFNLGVGAIMTRRPTATCTSGCAHVPTIHLGLNWTFHMPDA